MFCHRFITNFSWKKIFILLKLFIAKNVSCGVSEILILLILFKSIMFLADRGSLLDFLINIATTVTFHVVAQLCRYFEIKQHGCRMS
jgi:hypothetical protein